LVFDYKELLQFEHDNILEFPKSFDGRTIMVDVRKLLDGVALPEKRQQDLMASHRLVQEASPAHVITKPNKDATDKNRFNISISHPRFLAKKYESAFSVRMYLPQARSEVSNTIKRESERQKTSEHIYHSDLTVGLSVKVKLYSPEITFSDSVIKKLDYDLNIVTFLGKPNDNCQPGSHEVMLSISDSQTDTEYESINFATEVVDLVFGHISRPLLSNILTGILGIGSLCMYVLTLFEQIDKTLGLTSGTAAWALATAIFLRFFSLYQQQKSTSNP
jgi:hypothetical protein